jgi:hypothetical protein
MQRILKKYGVFNMLEVNGDIWNFHAKGEWICITTNGQVTSQGRNIMGGGTALQAAIKYPDLPRKLGLLLTSKYDSGSHRNLPYLLSEYRIFSFPTKDKVYAPSSLGFIEKSAKNVVIFIDRMSYDYIPRVYLPRPGCGLGELQWEDVRPVLVKHFDDRFIVVNWTIIY